MGDQPKELAGSNDLEKFGSLAKLTHKQQAIWFLNGMWEKGCGEAEAENVWKYVHMYNELDLKKKAEGCELDELNAHVFLEKNNEAMTVKQLRDKLREIGWEKRPMMFPLTVYLILRYKADWKYVVNSPQGGNDAEIDRAQQMLREAQEACDQATAAAEEAAAAAAEAKKSADAAERAASAARKAAEEADRTHKIAESKAEDARIAEAPLKAAEEEVKAALAEVQSQESARDNKTKDLTKKSEEGGAVSRNKAKAELAAHLAEDPLPLRKAKITLEAAERKAEKARAPFKIAREAAEQAAAEAQAAADAAADAKRKAEAASAKAAQAAKAAEAASAAAEAALQEALARVAEAEAYLEEQKAKASSGKGLLWYLTRELEEMKKYMPASKLKKLA